jgi:hypothetical protein
MFNFKSQLLGAAAVLPIAAAGLLGSAGSAQALGLNGSIELNGTAGSFNTSVNPGTTTFSFADVDSVVGYDDFAGIGLHTSATTINTLTLTLEEILAPTASGATRGRYSTGALSPWINFGTKTIGGVTSNLSFNLNNTQVLRTRTSSTGVRIVDIEGLTGAFFFNGLTLGTGFLSGSRSGNANSYEITLEAKAVPEPTTMLGLGLVAAGMTVASRRKLVKA